jgi:hypothetical protein
VTGYYAAAGVAAVFTGILAHSAGIPPGFWIEMCNTPLSKLAVTSLGSTSNGKVTERVNLPQERSATLEVLPRSPDDSCAPTNHKPVACPPDIDILFIEAWEFGLDFDQFVRLGHVKVWHPIVGPAASREGSKRVEHAVPFLLQVERSSPTSVGVFFVQEPPNNQRPNTIMLLGATSLKLLR